MPTLAESASQFQINPYKPFFPVNSLRLLYFMIASYFTGNNQQTIDQVGSLIPKLEAVFTARARHRAERGVSATVESDWLAVQAPLQDLFQVVNTATTRAIFDQLFTYIYPFQDELLLSFSQEMSNDHPLTAQHLMQLLRVRAMDSIVFATVLAEVIQLHRVDSPVSNILSAEDLTRSLDHHLNLSYQMNDIVDTVVFAKEDLEGNNFSLFQVVQKIAPDSTAAKELITSTLTELQKDAQFFAFPATLQNQVQNFYSELVKVIQAPNVG